MENFGKDWSTKITKAQIDNKPNSKLEHRKPNPPAHTEDKPLNKQSAKIAKQPANKKRKSSSEQSDSLEDFVASSEHSESAASNEASHTKKKHITKRPPQTNNSQSKSQSNSSKPPHKQPLTHNKLKKTGKSAPKRKPEADDSDIEATESEYDSDVSDRPKKRPTKKQSKPVDLDDSDLELIEKFTSKPRAQSKQKKPPTTPTSKPKHTKAALSDEGDSDSAPRPSHRGRRKIIDSHDEDESY